MREPWEVIQELEADNSRLAKEAVIKVVATHGNDFFFEGCRLALDPMVTFGLKQVPEKTEESKSELHWDIFKEMTDELISRRVTGNAARALVDRAMSLSSKDAWNNWYRRILIKDLRCGVSEKTINKVVEKINANYIVPTFSCQLAHDSANHEGKLTGQKLVEVKLDGVRVITIVWPDGRVLQFSRNGKELSNFDNIRSQLVRVSNGFNEPMVLDGEVMSSSFQDLMKQVHRKENVVTDDAVLHLFDYLTLKEFEQGAGTAKQIHRSIMLQEWYDTVRDQIPNVTVLQHEEVDLDTDEGQKKFKEINQKAVAGGYEGIMIKNPNAIYECKRTTSWLKLKPFIEVSLEVTDVEEGTGRNVGRLGALVCEGDDDSRRIRVNVGSGFSDSDRDTFWNSRNDVLGRIVEVRADAVTQNQDGSYSLRFPRFLKFRGFEIGEKL